MSTGGSQQFDLEGRVAVVTGGYGVLGGVIAAGLAEAGAHTVILGRDKERSERKATVIREESGGVRTLGLSADVTNEEQLRIACAATLDAFGRVDILVNAAGGNVASARSDDRPVFDVGFDAFDEVVRLNLHGTVYPTLVFGDAMAARNSGSIVNISSMAALLAISGVSGYSVAKGAIDNFTRWLSADVARRHGPEMRVNAIAPGFFVTQQNRDVLLNEDGTFTDRSRTILAQTPAGRFGRPEEVVGTAVWLCSDAASFVTGVVVPIDGGFSVWSGV